MLSQSLYFKAVTVCSLLTPTDAESDTQGLWPESRRR
jgi:hypothetical protein